MRVQTKPYGPIDIDERQKLHFTYGILGFENLKSYVLLDAVQQPFYWLQSLDVVEIAFVLIDPRIFQPEYTLEINQEEMEEIGLTGDENLLFFSIVTIPDDPMDMTANLRGPIIINKANKMARQSITTNPRWQVRHPILKELALVKQGG